MILSLWEEFEDLEATDKLSLVVVVSLLGLAGVLAVMENL
jgi:hypothetical protein